MAEQSVKPLRLIECAEHRGQSLPHHEMLKRVSSLLKVDAKVVHDSNIIVKFLNRG